MINHLSLGESHFGRTRKLCKLLNEGKIVLGGNKKLKIYGTLNCQSGKKMKLKNRVFFQSEKEALINHYRPCSKCMRSAYLLWKTDKLLQR